LKFLWRSGIEYHFTNRERIFILYIERLSFGFVSFVSNDDIRNIKNMIRSYKERRANMTNLNQGDIH